MLILNEAIFQKTGLVTLLHTRQQTNQQIAPKRTRSRKACSIFNKSGNGVKTSTEVSIVRGTECALLGP
jgi:hypothetical protein